MAEGLEGPWPAPGWQLTDQSASDGGEYLWGKRDCHPRTGRYAAWCVGGGAQGAALPCSLNYPMNTDTWAVYGPFDLTDASSAQLVFYYWGRSEYEPTCRYDYLFVGSSADAEDFSGFRFCGRWTDGQAGNGYHRGLLDLSDRLGQEQVWVAFAFMSDDSIATRGFMIDDIALETSICATATPTPTRTPFAAVAELGLPLAIAGPRPTPTATPAPAPTRTPAVARNVVVALWCSRFDAPGDDRQNLNEEYVCFENIGQEPTKMNDWHAMDAASALYTFGAFTLPAGSHMRLHTGPGTDTTTDLYWGRGAPVWNNDHDTVYLYDASWNLVDQVTY